MPAFLENRDILLMVFLDGIRQTNRYCLWRTLTSLAKPPIDTPLILHYTVHINSLTTTLCRATRYQAGHGKSPGTIRAQAR